MLATDRLADMNSFHYFPWIGIASSEQAIQVWRQSTQAAE